MNASDWPALVADNPELGSHWNVPPELDACDLFYVQVDERSNSVTLGFEAPTDAESEAEAEQLDAPNSVEFYLSFTGTERIRVIGWQAPGSKRVLLHSDASGSVHFRAEGEGSHLEFTASEWGLVDFRARRVSR